MRHNNKRINKQRADLDVIGNKLGGCQGDRYPITRRRPSPEFINERQRIPRPLYPKNKLQKGQQNTPSGVHTPQTLNPKPQTLNPKP